MKFPSRTPRGGGTTNRPSPDQVSEDDARASRSNLDVDQIIARYRAGLSIQAIATEAGITAMAVYGRINKLIASGVIEKRADQRRADRHREVDIAILGLPVEILEACQAAASPPTDAEIMEHATRVRAVAAEMRAAGVVHVTWAAFMEDADGTYGKAFNPITEYYLRENGYEPENARSKYGLGVWIAPPLPREGDAPVTRSATPAPPAPRPPPDLSVLRFVPKPVAFLPPGHLLLHPDLPRAMVPKLAAEEVAGPREKRAERVSFVQVENVVVEALGSEDAITVAVTRDMENALRNLGYQPEKRSKRRGTWLLVRQPEADASARRAAGSSDTSASETTPE